MTAHAIVPTDGVATNATHWCLDCDSPAEFCEARPTADEIRIGYAWPKTDQPTVPSRTWNGAPVIVYRDAWGTIFNLPEGHADLGYAPGSQFYATDADLADLAGDPLPAGPVVEFDPFN